MAYGRVGRSFNTKQQLPEDVITVLHAFLHKDLSSLLLVSLWNPAPANKNINKHRSPSGQFIDPQIYF